MNLEKLEVLPKKQNRWQYLTDKFGSIWNTRLDYKDGSYDVYKIADRVCKAYIGKKWDDAFSYYCKLVPKNVKNRYEAFCNRFKPNRRFRYDEWFVEDGIIIHKSYTRSKKITIRSLNYKTQLLHKQTHKPLPTFHWIYNKKYTSEYIDQNYSYFIVEGWEREFSSKNDHIYKRLYKEQQDYIKKESRIFEKQKEEKQYELLSLTEKKILEEKERNSIDIDRLGFDEKSSFKKIKK